MDYSLARVNKRNKVVSSLCAVGDCGDDAAETKLWHNQAHLKRHLLGSCHCKHQRFARAQKKRATAEDGLFWCSFCKDLWSGDSVDGLHFKSGLPQTSTFSSIGRYHYNQSSFTDNSRFSEYLGGCHCGQSSYFIDNCGQSFEYLGGIKLKTECNAE